MQDKTLVLELADRFTAAIKKVFGEANQAAEVTQSTNPKFGHYQCNSAMRLGGNPREAAAQIIDAVDSKGIKKLEIAGPGFINITLEEGVLSERVNDLLADPRLGLPPLAKPLRAVVEFSSPNTAKEMHVGHLRSTIIGDSIAHLLEFMGHDVIRLNHIGDWGTQFGMLIAYMKEFQPEVLAGEVDSDLQHLVAWYRGAKVKFDEDAHFKTRSRLEVVALQGGNQDSLHAWNQICAISRTGYQEIYDLLGVKLEERGESTYNPVLGEIVTDMESKGLVSLSQGAKCVYMDGFTNREGDPLPMIIQKSDGGYLYATTDLAALRQRVEGERADWLVYVTDMGQATHFAMVFKAGEAAGYVDRSKVRIDHVPFGLVLGPDGKKFATRSGETERLIDVLKAAIAKAREMLEERGVEGDLDEIARALGLGAVKYSDLSQQRVKDYTFSYERMLRFEGNTAPFLLYAYVRIVGIKRKVGGELPVGQIVLNHPSEVALGLHLCQFAEALESVARELLPNRLADYLYGLAERFNAFHRDCRVEGTEEQTSRLLLCEAAARVLKQGLNILGLSVVSRM